MPIGRHVQIDNYYEHENNTGKKPNKQDNCWGLSLQLYFSTAKGSRSSGAASLGKSASARPVPKVGSE